MLSTRLHKNQILRPKHPPLPVIHNLPGPRNNNIKFILRMRRLPILPHRRINPRPHRPMSDDIVSP